MKKYIVFILLIFTSCEKYVTNVSDLTLSGRYIVNQIDVIYSDRPSQKFIGGQTYKSDMPQPFDSITVNGFYILLDGSGTIGFFKLVRLQPFSSNKWLYGNNKDLYFNVYGNNAYNLGYLNFRYIPIGSNGYQNVSFKIEEDGFENLKLLTTGSYGSQDNKTQIRLYLQREHP